jgi:hypothetical protein
VRSGAAGAAGAWRSRTGVRRPAKRRHRKSAGGTELEFCSTDRVGVQKEHKEKRTTLTGCPIDKYRPLPLDAALHEPFEFMPTLARRGRVPPSHPAQRSKTPAGRNSWTDIRTGIRQTRETRERNLRGEVVSRNFITIITRTACRPLQVLCSK